MCIRDRYWTKKTPADLQYHIKDIWCGHQWKKAPSWHSQPTRHPRPTRHPWPPQPPKSPQVFDPATLTHLNSFQGQPWLILDGPGLPGWQPSAAPSLPFEVLSRQHLRCQTLAHPILPWRPRQSMSNLVFCGSSQSFLNIHCRLQSISNTPVFYLNRPAEFHNSCFCRQLFFVSLLSVRHCSSLEGEPCGHHIWAELIRSDQLLLYIMFCYWPIHKPRLGFTPQSIWVILLAQ